MRERTRKNCGRRASRPRIGDVAVVLGQPLDPRGPLPGESLCGVERARALMDFKRTGGAAGYTFWHTPASGEVRRLCSSSEVDWRDMR